MSEPIGPVTLREKPRAALVDRDAYAIPDHATREDYSAVAAWVRFLGGDAHFYNGDGVLVTSNYRGEAVGDRYYEWVSGPGLLVHNPESGEFSCYGYQMADHYVVEPFSGEGAGRG